jgi:hypothetical protein
VVASPSVAQARAFVRREGIVLVAARGPVPALVEFIAGEPIRGSWWSHPRSAAIFRVLNAVLESPDLRMFRLVEAKVTVVHRRLWPALVRLAKALPKGALDAIRQEHTDQGRHRAVKTPYPEWVTDAVRTTAEALSEAEAWELLPSALQRKAAAARTSRKAKPGSRPTSARPRQRKTGQR